VGGAFRSLWHQFIKKIIAMTVVLIVLNLLLNINQTVITNDAGKQDYQQSTEYVVVDELSM
jgi:hypothetical protein